MLLFTIIWILLFIIYYYLLSISHNAKTTIQFSRYGIENTATNNDILRYE